MIVDESLLSRLEEERAPLDRISVQVLGLSARGYNALKNSRINTIQELIDCNEGDLLSIRNIGVTTLDDITNKLVEYLSQLPWKNGHLTLESLSPLNDDRHKQEKTRIETPLSISGAIEQLLSTLTERQAKILRLRYGLEDGQIRTLEDVGRKFDVTRERIRQIQAKALRRLRHPSKKKYLDVISSLIESILKEAGGILRESDIHGRLGEAVSTNDFHPAGIVRFIFQLSPKFLEIEDEVWVPADAPLEHIPTVIEHAMRLLEIHKTRMRFNALVSEVKHVPAIFETVPVLDTLFIEACIKVSAEIEITSDSWCSLAKWRASYLDDVIEILRIQGKPLHYTAITKKINELCGDKHVVEHNIHALLQREKSVFVRVEPGTYGLIEWGLKRTPYFLRLIENALRKAGKPLTSREVMTCVSEVRACKESTILMYLTLNERFVRLESGGFALREWLTEKEGGQPEYPSHLTASFINQLKKEAMDKLSTELESGSSEGS